MLKQLRRSTLAGASLWREHWREFADIRFDRESLRWDGFVDLVDARAQEGPILEAGCGLGRYLLYLRAHGARVAGVDFAREPLAAVRAAIGPAPVAVADLRALPFATGAFSTILCLGVLEHFEDGPAPALREMVRTLKPGGLLIATVPYANALKLRRARQPGTNIVPGDRPVPDGWTFYQFCYRADELRGMLEQAGLTVIAERLTGRLFTFAGWAQGLLGRRRHDGAPRAAETGAQAPSAVPVARSTPAPLLKRLLKEAAYRAQPILPGHLLAHMVLAVGRKPGGGR